MSAKTRFMIYILHTFGDQKEVERFGITRLLALELASKDPTGESFTLYGIKYEEPTATAPAPSATRCEKDASGTAQIQSLIRELKGDEKAPEDHHVDEYEFPSCESRQAAWKMLVDVLEVLEPEQAHAYMVNETHTVGPLRPVKGPVKAPIKTLKTAPSSGAGASAAAPEGTSSSVMKVVSASGRVLSVKKRKR